MASATAFGREIGGVAPAGAPALVLHIPHASPVIPAEERALLVPDDRAIARELLAMTDAWTDRLVEGLRLRASRVVFPVSRLVVDVERFPNDADEPMAAIGMGAVYTRLSTGAMLRRDDALERQRLMTRYYHAHHARLRAAVEASLAAHGRCLIIDVHSFPARPLPYERDQAPDRPEICIGTEAWHSPFADDADAAAAGSRLGFVTALNRPFSGSIVPAAFWRVDRRVRSMMIEVRRDLYMDEGTGGRSPGFARAAARVCRLLEDLAGLAGAA